MSRKFTVEEAEMFLKNLGYKLIGREYFRNNQKLIFKDKEGYYYFVSLNSLKSKHIPSRFNIANPYTIYNIKLWVKLNNKSYKLVDITYISAIIKLKWQCLKEGCGEIFSASWNQIFAGKGCGVCDGKQVVLSNCLATKRPELIPEWHSTKNGNLTPYDFAEYSNKKVWWKCRYNSKHEWKSEISNRTNMNCGCPYCSGLYPSEDYNLLLDNPKLCEEWDYDNNKKFPTEYTPHSGEKVYWICRDCGNSWEASIAHRNNDRCCPSCRKSKGEKRCKEVFDLSNIYYIPQKTFDGLIGLGNGLLSYDFYLPKYNLLIEYQGQYHDGTAGNQTPEEFIIQVEHDRRKKEYALNNKYNFLEIWYKDFDNIENILDKYLNQLEVKIS